MKTAIFIAGLLASFAIQAKDALPFNPDYSKLKLADPLQFYANIRTSYGDGIDSKVDGRTREDEEKLRLGIRYQQVLGYGWFFKGDIQGVFLHRQNRNNAVKEEIWDSHFEVRELYFENKHLINNLPIGILAGRKKFRDDRGWWYDNQLDVAQLQYNSTLVNAEFSYGGRLKDERVSSENQNIGFEKSEFLIGHLDYQFYYQHYWQPFLIYQSDNFSSNKRGRTFDIRSSLEPETDLLWLGFRFNGLFSLIDRSTLNYWIDLATVNGSEHKYITSSVSPSKKAIVNVDNIDVSFGYGIDLGLAWKSNDDSFGLAGNYAFGSGDKSDAYRQPAISNNKSRVLGESRTRIYGELLRPELRNLQLISITTGYRLNQYLWLQGSYFHYWQVEADRALSASILTSTPNGKDKEIGNELDIVLTGQWNQSFNLQLTLSGFHAGEAFDYVTESKYAYKGVLKFKFYW